MQCSSNFTIVDKVSWGNILQNQCKKHKQSQNRHDLGKFYFYKSIFEENKGAKFNY